MTTTLDFMAIAALNSEGAGSIANRAVQVRAIMDDGVVDVGDAIAEDGFPLQTLLFTFGQLFVDSGEPIYYLGQREFEGYLGFVFGADPDLLENAEFLFGFKEEIPQPDDLAVLFAIPLFAANPTGLTSNAPPAAEDDALGDASNPFTDEDTPATIAAADLLANDSDPDDDPLAISAVDGTSAAGASLSLADDGSITYDPAGSATLQALGQGESTTDTFTVTVSDGNGGTDTATVTVTVGGVNDPAVITGLDGETVNVPAGSGPTPLFPAGIDVLDAEGNIGGGALIITVPVALADTVALDTSLLALSGDDGVLATSEDLSIDGRVVGSLSGIDTPDQLGVTLFVIGIDADATLDDVRRILEAFTIEPAGAGSNSIAVAIRDGESGVFSAYEFTADVTGSAPPVNTVPAEPIAAIDGTPVAVAGLSVADEDSDEVETTVSVADGDGTFTATAPDGALLTGAGTAALTVTGSPATVSATLATLAYTPALNAAGPFTVTVVTRDGPADAPATNSDTDTFTVVVNDRPNQTGRGIGTTHVEDGGPVRIYENYFPEVSDANGTLAGGRLEVAVVDATALEDVGLDPTLVTFGAGPGGATSVSVGGVVVGTLRDGFDGADGTALIVDLGDDATPERVTTLVSAIIYDSAEQDPGAERDVAVTVSDGTSERTVFMTVELEGVNDAPTADITALSQTFRENPGDAVALFDVNAVSTVEAGQSLTGFTLTFDALSDGADEILEIGDTQVTLTDGTSLAVDRITIDVAAVGDSATVTVGLPNLSVEDFGVLLESIAYRNTSVAPTSGQRLFTFASLTDDGGTDDGGEDTATFSFDSTVTVIGSSADPTIESASPAFSVLFVGAGTQPVPYLRDIAIGDVDSPDFDGGLLEISRTSGGTGTWSFVPGSTGNVDGSEIIPLVTGGGERVAIGGIDIGILLEHTGGADGRLRIGLEQGATPGQIEALVSALLFSPQSTGSGFPTDFGIRLEDGDGGSIALPFSVALATDAPQILGLDGDATAAPNGASVAIDIGANATVEDADHATFDGGELAIARLTTLSGAFSLSGAGATGVSSGSSVDDADGAIALGETIFVDGVAIGVVVFVAGEGGLRIDLGQGAERSNDGGSGSVAAFLQALRFTSTDAGTHTFTLSLRDGLAGLDASGGAEFSVTVEAVPGAPEITVPDGATVADGLAAPIPGIEIADEDAGIVETTVSVPAGAGTFAATAAGGATLSGAGTEALVVTGSPADVTATLGSLAFTATPDTTGDVTVTVTTADDTAGPDGPLTDTATFAVTVNDRPNIENVAEAFDYSEGSGLVPLFRGAVAVVDLDTTDFRGSVLAITPGESGGPSENIFVDTTGRVSLAAFGLGEFVVSVDDAPVGIITVPVFGLNGERVEVAFTDPTTRDQLEALVTALTYVNAAQDPAGTRTFALNLETPTGTSDPVQVEITLVPTDDPPTVALENVRQTIDERADTSSPTKIADIVVTDDGLGSAALSLTGADAASFEIVGTELFLRAGVVLDFAAQPSYSVGVAVIDALLGAPASVATLELTVIEAGPQVVPPDPAPETPPAPPPDPRPTPIIGTPMADTLVGGDGDDTIFGRDEGDLLDGGPGNDSLSGEAGNDTLVGGDGDDILSLGDGDDTARPGSGADRMDLGAGTSTILGTLAELGGDTVSGFGSDGDTIVVEDSLFRRGDVTVTVTGSPAILGIDTDGDGTPDATIALEGDFDGGDFMVVRSRGNTEITFGTFLPALADGASVDPALVNGILNRKFLNGDNASAFEVELIDLGHAGFDNVLGAYEITPDGAIVDVVILSANANADVGRTVRIENVDPGHDVGFFLVQDGAEKLGQLGAVDTLAFVDGDGAPASVEGGPSLSLLVNGVTLGLPVWHSFSPDLNSDGVQHALSGVAPGGEAIVVGFEDLTGGGDRDYEDVVFRITPAEDPFA